MINKILKISKTIMYIMISLVFASLTGLMLLVMSYMLLCSDTHFIINLSNSVKIIMVTIIYIFVIGFGVYIYKEDFNKKGE